MSRRHPLAAFFALADGDLVVPGWQTRSSTSCERLRVPRLNVPHLDILGRAGELAVASPAQHARVGQPHEDA